MAVKKLTMKGKSSGGPAKGGKKKSKGNQKDNTALLE
jgi:hypothetical protein